VIKVLLEKTIEGEHAAESVQLLRQMRGLAAKQPGYLSGEILQSLDDPSRHLVISTWESLDSWQTWFNNPERRKLQAEVDGYWESPTTVRVFA
jgi:heme-degrading monooxygenase HmoA